MPANVSKLYGTCGPEFGVKEEISEEDGKAALPCTCVNNGGLLCTAN